MPCIQSFSVTALLVTIHPFLNFRKAYHFTSGKNDVNNIRVQSIKNTDFKSSCTYALTLHGPVNLLISLRQFMCKDSCNIWAFVCIGS